MSTNTLTIPNREKGGSVAVALNKSIPNNSLLAAGYIGSDRWSKIDEVYSIAKRLSAATIGVHQERADRLIFLLRKLDSSLLEGNKSFLAEERAEGLKLIEYLSKLKSSDLDLPMEGLELMEVATGIFEDFISQKSLDEGNRRLKDAEDTRRKMFE